jgi:hypothetical protein
MMSFWDMCSFLGMTLAVILAICFVCWFSDFFWEEPDYGHDPDATMMVMVEHEDGTVSMANMPSLASLPDPRKDKIASTSKAWLLGIVVVIVILLSGYRK